MSPKHQHFAQRVLAGFATAGRDTDVEVANAGGPSSTTMTQLRKAAAGQVDIALRNDTLRRIDSAAGWAEGSAKAFWLHGVEPGSTEDESEPESAGDYYERLEARIAETERRLGAIESLLQEARIGHVAKPAQKRLQRGHGITLSDDE